MLKYILPLLLLTSCYTERKAVQQVAKADATYPAIIPNICASRYPVRTNTNTVIEHSTDTMYQEGETMIVNDTVIRVITKIVTNTVTKTITDTIENTAKIAALNVEVSRWQDSYVKAQDKADTLRNGRNTWRWIGIVSLAAILVYVVLRILGALKIVKI